MRFSEISLKKWKYLSFALIGILAIGYSVPQATAHITSNQQHMIEHIYNYVNGVEPKVFKLPDDPASDTTVNTRSSQDSVDTIQTSVDTVQGSVDALQVTVDGVGASVNAVQSSVDTIQTSVDTVQGSVDALQVTVDGVGASANAIKAKTDNLPSDPASQSDIGITKSIHLKGIFRDAPDSDSEPVTLIPTDVSKTFSGRLTASTSGSPGNTVLVYCISPQPASNLIFPIASIDTSTSTTVNEEFACSGMYIAFNDNPGSGDAYGVTMTGAVEYTEISEVVDIT